MSRTFIVRCPKCGSEAKLMFSKREDTAALECNNKCPVKSVPINLHSVRSHFPEARELLS